MYRGGVGPSVGKWIEANSPTVFQVKSSRLEGELGYMYCCYECPLMNKYGVELIQMLNRVGVEGYSVVSRYFNLKYIYIYIKMCICI